MGQQNSSQSPNNFARRGRAPARPSQLPQRSKSLSPPRPSYAVDENLVLPFPIKERQLRPVSAELGNLYPDYNSVFVQQDDPNEDDMHRGREETRTRRDDTPTYVRSRSYPDHDDRFRDDRTRTKHHVIPPDPEEPEKRLKRSNTYSGDKSPEEDRSNNVITLVDNNNRPSRSMSLDRKNQRRVRQHKRYPSISTNLTNPENTILEDPSEPAYSPIRNQSPMRYSGISLPKQSTFEMDYKYQLTYTQLAEHRRATHLAEIERKTGKKLEDLSADLAGNTDWGDGYDTPPQVKRQHSDSMKSGASGKYSTIDKQKKKTRAPPPPKQKQKKSSKPVEIHGNRPCPDPDYDMTGVSPPRGFEDSNGVSRSSSSVSHYKERTASDIMDEMLITKKPLSEIDKMIKKSPSQILDEMLLLKQQNITSVLSAIPVPPPPPQFADDRQAITITEITNSEDEKADDSRTDSADDKKGDEDISEPKDEIIITAEERREDESRFQRQDSSEKTFPSGQRRMSSLLMYDIVAAATARTTVIEKKSTPIPSKPKDPHQIFREQLAKACNKREERLKDSNIDDMIPSLNKSSTENAMEMPALRKTSSEWNKPDDDDKSRFSMEWTPDDDLSEGSDERDDNKIQTSKGRDTPDGFKSSIIPSKMEEMKSVSKYQKKENSKKYKKPKKLDDENPNKYGSLRKFKKSVNKGVKTAFGSISKASGKILRRQKQVYDEPEMDAELETNWDFLHSSASVSQDADIDSEQLAQSGGSDHRADFNEPIIHTVGNGDDVSSDEELSESELSSDEETNIKPPPLRRKYSSDADVDEVTNGDAFDKNRMKRAGIAYVSKNGQIVVLPESQSMNAIDKDGRAPKINRRKKKYAFESSTKKKEKSKIEEQISDHIREKEARLDVERKKQIEMELEYRKLRELEAKEKLQKLQTAQLQHQLSAALAQQHVNDMHNSMVPQTSVVPSFGPPQSLASLFNHPSFSSPQLTSVGMSFNSLPTGQMIGDNTADIYLADYLKMLGTNKSPTPQQYAFMLNKINWRSTSFDDPSTFNVPLLNGSLSSVTLNNNMEDVFGDEQKQRLIKKIVNAKLSESLLGDSESKSNISSHNVKGTDNTESFRGSAQDVGDSISLKNNPIYSSSEEEESRNSAVFTGLKPKLSNINNILPSDSTSSSSMSNNSSPRIPTKAYGPVGYRPVTFDPARSKRRQFAEHEESNDSGVSER